MSETAAAKGRDRSLRAYWALGALIAGLLLGTLLGGGKTGPQAWLLATAEFVGTLWLNALKMTVIPLVVALLIVGIAKGAEAAQGGRIAARTVGWAVAICTVSAIVGALGIELLTSFLPLDRGVAASLQSALSGVENKANGPLPGVLEFFKTIIPGNVVAAASNGDILPLVVFSLLFALALGRIADRQRRTLVGFFEAVGDALLVIIGWVLALAPAGVLALAISVGATAGSSAFAGLGHYILLISLIGIGVTLCSYPLAVIAGRMKLGAFARALIAPQAVAISTRSSLASLPAMLDSVRTLGVREKVADVSLPIAVALFRATGPAMNVAVAFYVAHWLGLQPTTGQMIAATAVGAVMSYGAVSLPGEVSFISSIAPIAMALGVPVAPLALLVAVEMIPDIFRTVGNVSMDVTLATIVDHSTGENASES
ncbi:MAG TPA: dicarboxylate/amino acid:cation symporter [Sphingomicrobium sp.]|nr:dicarboxylate/amino acid:cation symporter [Sphingomicrobium sp.]